MPCLCACVISYVYVLPRLFIRILTDVLLFLPVMQQSASEKDRGRSGQFAKRKYELFTYISNTYICPVVSKQVSHEDKFI